MVVRLLNRIKNGDGYFPAGAVLEIDDSEARRLLKLKAARSMEDEQEDEQEDFLEDGLEEEVEPMRSLNELPGVKKNIVEALTEAGIYSIQELAKKDVDEIVLIDGIGARTAERLIDAANELLE